MQKIHQFNTIIVNIKLELRILPTLHTDNTLKTNLSPQGKHTPSK